MNTQHRLIPASMIRQHLARLEDVLSKGDFERLEKIVLVFEDNQQSEALLATCLDALAPDSIAQDRLSEFRTLRYRLKEAAIKAGTGLELAVDSRKRFRPDERLCWFTLPPDPTVDHVADWTEQETSSDDAVSDIHSLAVLVPRHLVALYDAQERDLARDLLQRLRRHVDAWGLENRDVSESEHPVQAFQKAVEGGDIGLHMMPVVLDKDGLIIPIDLKRFRYCDDKNRFVLEHAEKIRQCLSARKEKHRGKTERLAQDLMDKAGSPKDLRYVVDAKVQATSVDVSAATFPRQERRFTALEALEAWATHERGAPYCVLLGEYGIGKTTTLKQFAQSLLARRRKGEDMPLPIFIDLRAYSDSIRKGNVPDLETLLQEVLERVWTTTQELPFTAQDILRLVREEGAVLIFDGLDEKLVHLDEIQGRAFLRTLWQALPPSHFRLEDSRLITPRSSGRLVFSCRSHYFKTLRDQSAMFRGEDRDGIRANHYRAWYLLPFDEDQIRNYLSQVLEGDSHQVESVLEMFKSVHNLKELAPRPYLLSLMAEHISELDRRRVQGEVVRSVTLYESLVSEWLTRDNSKHKLRSEDKLYLMEDIAADMWREGAREWPWSRVLDWFTQRLDERTVWHVRYLSSQVSLELLEEDFRTATFVLRPDDSQDRFRFAHTSLQEYFLACYLHRALLEGEQQNWEMPLPSPETLDFLGELIAVNPETQDNALSVLATIFGQTPTHATNIAFHYWLRALEHELPEPTPQEVKLNGADLSGLTIRGRPKDRPLNLSAADLSEANLVGARFEDVDLSRASLSGAQARGAEFQRVTARNVDLAEADLTASVWRHSDISGLKGGATTIWHDVQLIACDLDPDSLPKDFGLTGTLSEPREPARSIPSIEGREASKIIALLGHADSILACAVTPDGRRLVSGSHDRTLKLWDLDSGNCLHTFEGHADWVLACAVTPDGRRLVSGSDDRTLKLWDLDSGNCLHTFEGHADWVRACAVTPDGRRLVSGSRDSTLKLWDLDSGNCLYTFEGHTTGVRACAITPDGRRLVSGSSDHTLKVWDLDSGNCLRTLEGHEDQVLACAVTPDGRRLVSGSDDHTLKVWDLESGNCLRTFREHRSAVPVCAVTPDGRRLVSGSDDRTLKLWDLDSGNCLHTFEGHADWVRTCAVTPDGRRLVSGSRDSTLKVWDLKSGHCLRTLGHTGAVWACAVTPDGRRLVSGSYDHTLKVWDLDFGSCLRILRHTGAVLACAVTPDGRRLVSGSDDRTLKIWDLNSGDCLRTLEGHEDQVLACAVTPDGQRLVSGSRDSTLKVWDLDSGDCLRTLEGHEDQVLACAVTPDGQRLVSGSRDSTLKVWDLDSGDCLRTLEGHADWVTACAVTPDGQRLVSGSSDHTLKVWDLESGGCLRTFKGHKHWVRACAVTPDSQRLVSGSNDHALKVWDLESGDCLRTLRHTGVVLTCAVTPDGRSLVSGARNSTLGIWDLVSYALKITLINGPNGETAALDCDAKHIISNSSEAWRFLGWQHFDPEAERLRILPAEHFGPLTTEVDRPI